MWRRDREEAWNLWLFDFLNEQIREHMVGHADHDGHVSMPSKEVLHALVDVGVVLGRTDWTQGRFGPELTNVKQFVDDIADGIITTYTNEMEEP